MESRGAAIGGVDVDPRCDGCGKRHTRGDFFTPPASHRGGIPTVRSSKIVSIAALLLVASVAAMESTTALPLPTPH